MFHAYLFLTAIAAQGSFGEAVAISGREVYVGQPGNAYGPGIVYVFRQNARGAWRAATKLTMPGATNGDGFGSALAIDGNTLFVGSAKADSGRGAVYVFTRETAPAGGWRESGRITATDRNAGDAFGDRSVRRGLEHVVLDDVTLSHEFRVAMLRLCQERLGRGDVDSAERDSVLAWLHGERVPATALRKVGLYTRVARHTARPLLISLSRWVRRAGRSGVVLLLDLERLAVTRRPPAGLRDGHYYSKAAALDVYEVLRQLIDATDEMEGLFVAVLLPPELVTDEGRGLPAYTALQLRVADEVRDRRRPNPYAALTRVGVRLEAVR